MVLVPSPDIPYQAWANGTFLAVKHLFLEQLISDVQSENRDGRTNGSFICILKVSVVRFSPKGAHGV